MKKILLLTGSNSPHSINRQLVAYAAGLLEDHEGTLIDLRNYVLPIFGMEIEQREGIPEEAGKLRALFEAHDAYIIAVAEHNSSMTAFLKNVLDWVSRAGKDYRFLENKPVLLLSTSPSPGGGRNALSHAASVLTILAGKIVGQFSMARYYDNVMVKEEGIHLKNQELHEELVAMIKKLEKELLVTECEYC